MEMQPADLNPGVHADDAILADLMSELNEDEIVEEAVASTDIEAELEAELAAEAAANAAVVEDDDTTVQPEADKPQAVTEKPAKKAKKEKEPKAPRVTSVTHKPGDRLSALLLAAGVVNVNSFLHFNKEDDTIAAEKRAEQFLADMNAPDAIADKVREKAVMLLTWIASGKDAGSLNEVLLRTFKVLVAEGKLTSGKDGNLQKNLLSKPYSPGTAASQANQMFMLLPILGVTKREKGVMVADENSVILETVKLQLGL